MPKQKIPDAEMDVLACLNREGGATAAQIREEFKSYRPMAHGSVVTLLNRLEAKGLVAKKKGTTGKAFVYSLTRKSVPSMQRVINRLVERVFGGNGVALVASLYESKPPTPAELKQLQDLLNDLRTKKQTGKKS